MHMQLVGSVLKRVLHESRLVREFSRLSHRNEPRAQRRRHRGAEDESSAFRPHDHIDALVAKRVGHELDGKREAGGAGQKRRDILEDDALLGGLEDNNAASQEIFYKFWSYFISQIWIVYN